MTVMAVSHLLEDDRVVGAGNDGLLGLLGSRAAAGC